ncbi:IS1 family transposase [Synechococcus sp. PCC 7502]|uniref:IS1 family transposase n=1 Tax=Synechococcus sp. PCC 7502 TaxID=1173263 RepID=UPI001FEEE38F|nr:IS1 family transposase [Synechococcus sp. PCC 7502]
MEVKCPYCESDQIVKNGITRHKKQNYKCKKCNRQFVINPKNQPIAESTIKLVDNLLLERISMRGIKHVAKVSLQWLQSYINGKSVTVESQVKVIPKKKPRLTIECDELWSFKVWIWLAIDRNTREIVGVFVGSRNQEAALGLWQSLPTVYRQCAVCYTDFWQAYSCILPKKRHKAVGKESGQTNHIERFNCTLRQRISRLVRKTLSFSKKLENHIGAIWIFIHHYNSEIHSKFCIMPS